MIFGEYGLPYYSIKSVLNIYKYNNYLFISYYNSFNIINKINNKIYY
jgi:hypothetical protein